MAPKLVETAAEIPALDFKTETIMVMQTNLYYFEGLKDMLVRYSLGPYVKFVIGFSRFGRPKQRGHVIFLDASDSRFRQFVANWCVKSKDPSVEWLHPVEFLQRVPNAWSQPRGNSFCAAEHYEEFRLRSAAALRLNVSDSESLKAFLGKYSLWGCVRFVARNLPVSFGRNNEKRNNKRGDVIFLDDAPGGSTLMVIESWIRKDPLAQAIEDVYFVHPYGESWESYKSLHTPKY